jgi:hypothetical protein
MKIMHPYGIIKKLEQTAKTNKKLEILKGNKDNEDLRQFFYMALEPSVTFGIKKIPDFERSVKLFSFDEAMMELYKFSSRELTGNAAIEHLAHVLANSSFEAGDLLIRIIKKDPGCKVAGSSVNKVWDKCITKTPYMRCSTDDSGIDYPAFAQEKANGVFVNAMNETRLIKFISRNGKEMFMHGYLEDEMKALSSKNNWVVLGEGLVMDEDGIHFLDRKTGNGIMNKAIKGTMSEDEASRVVLAVWDIIPLEAWKEGKCDFPYHMRYEKLERMVDRMQDEGFDKIMMIDTVEIENLEQAEDFFEQKIEEKKEGAVLKNKNGFWKNTSSGTKDQVKMKLKDPADLICVGTIPHTKNPVWIGSLVLESSDGIIKVSTGSGLTEGDRQEFPEHYIGKIIEMEYNEITEDKKTKQKSLYLPIYKGIRYDKDEADDYPNILERAEANRKKAKERLKKHG